jgi:hypothetical protein
MTASAPMIGARTGDGQTGAYLQGWVQFVTYWSTAMSADQVKTYMYTDPLYQDGLVADFGFTLDPPNDLMEGNAVTLVGGATLGEMRIQVPSPQAVADGQGLTGRAIPDQFARTALADIDGEALRRALVGIQPPAAQEGFGPEHERILRAEFERALPHNLDPELRSTYADHFEEQLALARRIADGEDVMTRFGRVVHEVVDGYHVVTHHTEDGSQVVLRASVDEVDPCVVWWITFCYTLLAGMLALFGFPTPTSRIQEFAQRIVNNPAFVQTVSSLIGGTFTALTILSFLKVLYDFGLLKSFVWFCITTASWWALARFVLYLIGLFAPLTTPQKALFIANAVVLVAQLVKQIAQYPCNRAEPEAA